jgi:hypothetical protein
MIKVELHTHTADDPADLIPHTTTELLERASALGYGAIALTLHDRQLDVQPFDNYARDRGLVLIRGIERTIHGKHVLLLNFPAAAERVQTFEEVATLKREHPNGLVIAPHPFYPGSSCLRSLMDRHEDLFDAVELNYFFTRDIDFKAGPWSPIRICTGSTNSGAPIPWSMLSRTPTRSAPASAPDASRSAPPQSR